MIKHFNTAMSMPGGKGGSSKGMGGTLIIGVGLILALYLGYKYIEKRNQPIKQEQD
jgi:hypothetical protein